MEISTLGPSCPHPSLLVRRLHTDDLLENSGPIRSRGRRMTFVWSCCLWMVLRRPEGCRSVRTSPFREEKTDPEGSTAFTLTEGLARRQPFKSNSFFNLGSETFVSSQGHTAGGEDHRARVRASSPLDPTSSSRLGEPGREPNPRPPLAPQAPEESVRRPGPRAELRKRGSDSRPKVSGQPSPRARPPPRNPGDRPLQGGPHLPGRPASPGTALPWLPGDSVGRPADSA